MVFDDEGGVGAICIGLLSMKAVNYLPGTLQVKTYHSSTLRSGVLFGVAIPAFVSGLYYSFLEETREQIHGWDALLFIYGLLFVPVVYSMLIGLNVLVWERCHINYAFLLGMDARNRMNYREYFEIPSLLFATLCHTFLLSFARIGSSHISPTTWPLLWLALTAAILFDPLPLLFRPSRSWLLRAIGSLFISWARHVEFTDFWLGDQFCSLVFTLSNLYMLVCVYVQGFQGDWNAICTTRSSAWPVASALTALPLLIRLAQSIRRYAGSGLITHLINGGKYSFGIVSYLYYYLWRFQDTHYNPWFSIWLTFAIIYSTYATCWDLIMDWSLLRLRARHFLLRNELGYPNHIYIYYFAIVTNCLAHFSWVIYIPEQGPNMLTRTFIVGFLEMLRRIQWNFYRLENEHIGNTDQYRVAGERPLLYAFGASHFGHHDGNDFEPLSRSPTPLAGDKD